MPTPRVGRRRDQRCWLEIPAERHHLIEPARRAFPDFTYQRIKGPSRQPTHFFTATLDIEGYEPRQVSIHFSHLYWWSPTVLADGPDDSPHRYPTTGGGRRRLCLWHPSDPPDRVWQPGDGLLQLFGMASVHLFKEAWWREHHIWIGDEYPHHDGKPKQPGDQR